MSYAADRTEDAEQAAPTESATQNADATESAAEVIGTSPTEEPAPSAAPPDADPAAAAPADAEPAAAAPPPAVDPWPADLPADVVEVARAAAAAEAGTAERIGAHVDSIAEDQIARTVRFAALDAGYKGWQWSVTLAVLPDGAPTVSEVVLLPGPDALVAPAWLPWDQRLRPGDLGPTDLLPAATDDPRLVPGYVESDDPAIEALATEVGLGRERVLSREGRDDAAERWHDGPFGPASPIAKAAPAHCGSCGFYAPLAGSLGGAFGVCANEFSPADARVVDVAFGCGAHSEVPAPPPSVPVGLTVLDEVTLEVHDRPHVRVDAAGDGSVAQVSTVEPDGGEHNAAEQDSVEPDAAALTDAAETAPTLDVVVEAGDLDPAGPAAIAGEPAATDAADAGADAAPGDDGPPVDGPPSEPVAVEPETVGTAAAVSGSEAEIVVAEPGTDPADGEPATG